MFIELPPKSIFPSNTPRYPNIWFYVDRSISCMGNYKNEFLFLIGQLEACTGMVNDFGYEHSSEGCDAFSRRRGLKAVHLGDQGEFSHDHALHMRFYRVCLKKIQHVKKDDRVFYQTAVSVHFEVDQPSRLHPHVDICPLCGCTGAYISFMGAGTKVKNEQVHDPLGLELLLYGTTRGEKIIDFDGVVGLNSKFRIDIEEFKSPREDINTAKVAQVIIRDRNIFKPVKLDADPFK